MSEKSLPFVSANDVFAVCQESCESYLSEETLTSLKIVGPPLLCRALAALIRDARLPHVSIKTSDLQITAGVSEKIDPDPLGQDAIPFDGGNSPQSKTGLPQLTKREREIAQLAAAGLKNQQIADQLFIDLTTVKCHLQNAYEKLGIKKRKQLRDICLI